MATYTKSAQTREHLFQTAFALFLEQGYDATSLKDIAEAAGVSTGTLYRYFPSKSDFLFQIRANSQEHLREMADTLPEALPLADKLCAIIAADEAAVSRGMEQAALAESDDPRLMLALALRRETYGSRALLEEEEGFRRNLREIYRKLIETEQARGTFDASADAQELSEIVSALYFQAIDRAILEGSFDVTRNLRPKLELIFGKGDTSA